MSQADLLPQTKESSGSKWEELKINTLCLYLVKDPKGLLSFNAFITSLLVDKKDLLDIDEEQSEDDIVDPVQPDIIPSVNDVS
jgi:hypothetical protein